MILKIYERFEYREATPIVLKEYTNIYDYNITADKLTDIDYFKKNSTQLSFSLIDEDGWLYDNIVDAVYNIGDFIGLVVRIFSDGKEAIGQELFTGYVKKFNEYDIKTKKISMLCFDFTNLLTKAEGYNLETFIETATGICQVTDEKGIYQHYTPEEFNFSDSKEALKFIAHIAGYRFFNNNEVFQNWLHRAYKTNGSGGYIDNPDNVGFDLITGDSLAEWNIKFDENDGKCFDIDIDSFTPLALENFDNYMMLSTYMNSFTYQSGNMVAWRLTACFQGIYPYCDVNGENCDIHSPILIEVWMQSSFYIGNPTVYKYDVYRLRGSTWGKILSSNGLQESYWNGTQPWERHIKPMMDRFHISTRMFTSSGKTIIAPYRKRNIANSALSGLISPEDYAQLMVSASVENSILYYELSDRKWKLDWTSHLPSATDTGADENYQSMNNSEIEDYNNVFKRWTHMTVSSPSTDVLYAYTTSLGTAGITPSRLNYTGAFDFSSIYYSNGVHSVKDILQLLTLTNNTAIRCTNLGVLLFEDKDSDINSTRTIIEDSDIINPKIKQLLKRNIKFELLEHIYTGVDTSNEYASDINEVTVKIESFYNNFFGRVVKSLTCAISYDINPYIPFTIGDGITIFEENYKIISIKNDLKGKKYIIETWNDSSGIKLLLEDGSGLFLYEDGDALEIELPGIETKTITVIEPVWGQHVDKNLGCTITWSSFKISPSETVKIYLYKNNSFYNVISYGTQNTGSYIWTNTGAEPSNAYKIYVELSSNTNVNDISDGVFHIDESSLTTEDGDEILLEDGDEILYEYGA